MPRFERINAPQVDKIMGWNFSVPVDERYETVTVAPGYVKSTPDTDHYARLEVRGLREIRVTQDGQTIERRTFPLTAR